MPELIGVGVVLAATAGALLASYVMWRVTSRSGLWSMAAACVLAIVAFLCAVVIGLLITRAWFESLH